jgi:hypothetical protein
MQGLNKQISDVTEALTKQLPDSGGVPNTSEVSSPSATSNITQTRESNPFLDAMDVDEESPIPPSTPLSTTNNPFLDDMVKDPPTSTPLSTMNDLMNDVGTFEPSVGISKPKRGILKKGTSVGISKPNPVAFKSPLSTVYNISPPAVPPKYSTREQRQSKRSTRSLRPDLTAYTRFSPTETSNMTA